jgi:peptidoglycan/LPS O-acetylase OafA/YrhL
MAEARTGHDNNYDVLRLLAAALVLVSHAFALLGRAEPAVALTHDTLGFDGVLIFFAMSGILVATSWTGDPRPLPFAAKRALRILPGLFVSCLVTAYVLGVAFTDLGIRTYLLSLGPVKYVVTNTLMLTNYSLPGVFSHNPSSTVNGSLGTLPIEVKAYVLLCAVGLLIAAKSWRARSALFVAVAVIVAVGYSTGVKSVETVTILFAVFAGGALASRLQGRIGLTLPGRPSRRPLNAAFLAALVAWVASYHVPFPVHVGILAVSVPYIILFLGHRGLAWARPLAAGGDVSYGLYIYAFPVEQALVALHPRLGWGALVLSSLAATYLLALASWRLVEQPSLRLKRLVSPRSPAMATRGGTRADEGAVSRQA